MEPAFYKGLSIELIKSLFSYDPEEGTITRIKSYGRAVAGTWFYDNTRISVRGTHVQPGRLAWALYHGKWPPKGYWVDHINGVPADNRIRNLRLVTPTQNQQNKAGYGKYFKGVTWRDRKDKPWQAKIRVNGVRMHLGSFRTEAEAAEAYILAALEYHGEFSCIENGRIEGRQNAVTT